MSYSQGSSESRIQPQRGLVKDFTPKSKGASLGRFQVMDLGVKENAPSCIVYPRRPSASIGRNAPAETQCNGAEKLHANRGI